MTGTLVLTVVLAAAIGVSLGLLGGGGSILAVPLLVYVAGAPVKEAIALATSRRDRRQSRGDSRKGST